MKSKEDLVYKIVAKIPASKVFTYGMIGQKLGIHPRQVGRVLHLNPDPTNIPCHRVVNAQGQVAKNYAFGGGEIQRQILEDEGVVFRNNKVDLEECLWEAGEVTSHKSQVLSHRQEHSHRRTMEREKLYQELEKFIYELEEDSRLNWIGMKDEPESEKVMQKYKALYTDEVLAQIKKEMEGEKEFFEKRELKMVYFTLLGMNSYEKLAGLSDEISAYFSKAETEIDGKKVPYYSLRQLLMKEDDFAKREFICEKSKEIVEEINPKMEESLRKDIELIKAQGFDSYIDLYQKEKEIDYTKFLEVVKKIKSELKDLYDERMAKRVEGKLGMPFSNIRSCHIAYLMNYEEDNKFFSKDKMLPAYEMTLEKMGLKDEQVMKNILIDLDDRPKKNPRAVCYPMRIPEEIHLVIKPTGTHDDFEAFFHEAGHCLHFAHFDKNLSFPFKELKVSHALHELFSYTFEVLTRNALWLEEFVGLKKVDAEQVAKNANLNNLFMLQRYLGKFHYEYEFFKNGADFAKGPELYKKYLSEYTGFDYHPSAYLNDMDGGFYSADYLRAWIGQAQLQKYLEEKFGERWFANAATGKWLKTIWSPGAKLELEELLDQKKISKPFDISPLVNSF